MFVIYCGNWAALSIFRAISVQVKRIQSENDNLGIVIRVAHNQTNFWLMQTYSWSNMVTDIDNFASL